VNHAGFDDARENLPDNDCHHQKAFQNGFDDAEKNSLDNDCHHQKGGECECTNTWF